MVISMKKHKTHARVYAVFSAVLTVALVLAQAWPAHARTALATTTPDTAPYKTILGDAVNYGIVVNTFTLEQGDAETNVAAVVATCTNQTGNDLTNEVVQPFILASVPNKFLIKGMDAYVKTTSADAHKIVALEDVELTLDTSSSKEELAAQVESMLAHVRNQSAELTRKEFGIPAELEQAHGKYALDVRNKGDGTFVVNVDLTTYDVISSQASALQVYMDEGQTVVFNVEGSPSAMQKFDLNGTGADSYLGSNAGNAPQSVVWNFPQATSLTIQGSITGVVLAPRASVTVNATSSGWLVANEVIIGSGEWHNVYQEVEDLRPSEPEGPGEPEKPSPEKPDEPEGPEDPNEPVEPQLPDSPNNPDNPMGPQAPEKPTDPGPNPDSPNAPNDPDAPNAPSNPVYPESPNQPDVPVIPESPNQPDDPGASAPDGAIPEPKLLVRTQKTALHDPATPVEGATYDLWRVGPNGQNTHIASQTSNGEGELLYELPHAEAASYYLQEEEAPFGYLVDPHPTDVFSIGYDEQGFYLAHEDDAQAEYVRAAADSTDDVVVLDYAPTNNPVANQAVRVGVLKRDRTTNDVLPGATLQIVDKATGEVVDSWTSTTNEHSLVGKLDTNRTYVLRELVAPAGYALASDVEFVLHEEGTHTTGEILLGEQATSGQQNALAKESPRTGMLTITLFNEPKPSVSANKTTPTAQAEPTASRMPLATTGDPSMVWAIVPFALVGAMALAMAWRTH